MSKIIYKYVINITSQFNKIKMPYSAQILDIQIQRSEWVLWALGSLEESLVLHNIACYFTGQKDIPENPGEYIKTIQINDLVAHFFYLGRD